jgi:alkanesulfonate monooxygenase SsuD/methylene tetrahydromethanopterin reductase-like flavin-dependent oxidoreductase (luciferase family)
MSAAVSHYKAHGRPDLRPIAIRHPVFGVSNEDLRAKADETIDKIIAALTRKE